MGKTIEALQDKRVVEVVNHALQYGDDSAAENFGVNHESLARYKREFRSRFGDFDRRALLEKIASHYTTEELKTIAAGQRGTIGTRKHIVSRAGEKVKIGFMSDTHIGSIYFRDEMFVEAIRIMTEEGCDFIVHTGDVTEGMSNRPDQIYELSELGYAAQKQKAIELLGMWDGPMYLIQGNHDCLDIETEVLTMDGWKKYNEISKSDLIYSYDISKGVGKWDSINEIIIKTTNEDMVSFDAMGHSFLATKNHRVLCESTTTKNGNKKYGDYEYIHADGLVGTKRLRCTAVSVKDDLKDIDDNILKLCGWFLSDGNIYRAKPSHTGRYCIYQSKDIDPILTILNDLGYTYKISYRERTTDQICGIKLKSKKIEKCITLSNESSIDFNRYLFDKKIPEWFFSISTRQFNVFFESFIDGDGSRYKNRPGTYIAYGTYKMLSDIQALCAVNGKRGYLSKDNRGAYRLNICNRETVEFSIKKRKKYIKSIDRIVWCLSVPETNFMVRRNGTTYFTGNSWFIKSSGAYIVEDIAKEIGAIYLGVNEGDIVLDDCIIKLWHGEDSGGYAVSYRLQKLIESFTGGEKPNVLLCGHTHKQGYFFDRNIHVVSGGALSMQSRWMRGKRLANHSGFHILDMTITPDGVTRFQVEWFPFFL